MAKAPPDIPSTIGERVVLRANSVRTGRLRVLMPNLWCHVDWDDGQRAPKICHQYELKRLPIDGS